MSADPLLGEIQIMPYNFAPRNWAYCDGQLIAISENSALFALLGTTYGGDGRTTFALPDLRGRTAVGVGTGPGLSPVRLGERGGAEHTSQVPAHTHTASLYAEKMAPDASNPDGKLLGAGSFYKSPSDGKDNKEMSDESIVVASAGQSTVSIRNPYLGLHYCIAMEGQFPSRN